MDLSGNPLAVLTFLSTPAVLTNASCVLLFGTGNRYGRAIDRMHALAEMVRAGHGSAAEAQLRQEQLDAGEQRVEFIVRALTCFYTAVACFTGSTLLCLVGTVLRALGVDSAFVPLLVCALATGAGGVLAVITGATMLTRESRYSLRILKTEREFLHRELDTIQQQRTERT